MFLTIANVLTADQIADTRAGLDQLDFVDGRATAGWSARLVKNNQQARSGDGLEILRHRLADRLKANALFDLAVRPQRLSPLIFARYGAGHAYGTHIDDALMGGIRMDVSFTLFLAEPAEYEGGELVIETTAGEDAVKLPAGSLYVYPAGLLHRVEPVTAGERQVAVGWARSFVRSAEQRELLFDLDTARRMVFEKDGKTQEFDLLSKCAANLLRYWADD